MPMMVGLSDLPTECLESVADVLCTRDKVSLALTCKDLRERCEQSLAYWSALSLTLRSPSSTQCFLAWLLPRRHLIKKLTLWELLRGSLNASDRTINAAALALLQQLGAVDASCHAALRSLLWHVTPTCDLQLTGLRLPSLENLELDWLDFHDMTATLSIPAGFGDGLPALTHLTVSHVGNVRMAPGSLPASLRCLVFNDTYSPCLVPTVVAALQPCTPDGTVGLQLLHIRNLERQGIELSLQGIQALAPSLTSMLLQHPYQSDPLPHLCTLTGLRELDINHVSVTTGIYSVTRLSSLTSLALNGCAVQTLPAAIWTLPQLQVLELADNFIQGGLPGIVASATGLTRLALDLTYVSEGGMQLGRLPSSLRCLTLLWRPADLPGRLCGTLPYLRSLRGTLRTLELVRSSFWLAGQPISLWECPASVSALAELLTSCRDLDIALSRF